MRIHDLCVGITLFVASGWFATCTAAVPGVQAVPAYPQLTFTKPLALTWMPGTDERLLVTEQDGTIRLVRPGADAAPLVLDLRGVVLTKGREEGLLSLALHPKFANNGRAFVWYCVDNPRRNQLVEYHWTGKAFAREPVQTLVSIDDPASNHNGGTVVFGPDGMLYLSTGDGGKGGDPWGNAQNTQVLLGKILRIDVDAKQPYGIPADNPFANSPKHRPEIWAYGLRNVWRMSFDRENGELWAGDVGQNTVEEVSIIVKGGNYGWNLREGKRDFKMVAHTDTLIEPVWEYTRELGISITGGYVYRGAAMPALIGWYICGDFQTGRLWALRRKADNPAQVDAVELPRCGLPISSFGEAPDGELYLTAFDGKIYQLAIAK